ncbi:hypothetical protein [Pseudomonas kielensis]|uniref:Uncharacterized protein n=1 Tax=Pseudomonas kielensis TaxID=2762577 RepID=A0A7X1GJG9_9PSED|nr:hypothetical protein [Pseudomonas kielensis]MBC2692748.1 hypothetical protein [Pseudomonas kielensis]
MRDTQLVGTRTLGFSLPAEQFRTMNLYANQHGMSVRNFMAYIVESYLDAMKATPAK